MYNNYEIGDLFGASDGVISRGVIDQDNLIHDIFGMALYVFLDSLSGVEGRQDSGYFHIPILPYNVKKLDNRAYPDTTRCPICLSAGVP